MGSNVITVSKLDEKTRNCVINGELSDEIIEGNVVVVREEELLRRLKIKIRDVNKEYNI